MIKIKNIHHIFLPCIRCILLLLLYLTTVITSVLSPLCRLHHLQLVADNFVLLWMLLETKYSRSWTRIFPQLCKIRTLICAQFWQFTWSATSDIFSCLIPWICVSTLIVDAYLTSLIHTLVELSNDMLGSLLCALKQRYRMFPIQFKATRCILILG